MTPTDKKTLTPQKFVALFYYRENGVLQDRFMDLEAPSLAAAKRAAKANARPNERLVYVQPSLS